MKLLNLWLDNHLIVVYNSIPPFRESHWQVCWHLAVLLQLFFKVQNYFNKASVGVQWAKLLPGMLASYVRADSGSSPSAFCSCSWESSCSWLKYLGPATHVVDPVGVLGVLLWPGLILHVVVAWGVNLCDISPSLFLTLSNK